MIIDLYSSLTRSNKIKIAKAIQNEEFLEIIKDLLRREESRLLFDDLLK